MSVSSVASRTQREGGGREEGREEGGGRREEGGGGGGREGGRRFAVFEGLKFVVICGRVQAVYPGALIGCARGDGGGATYLLRVQIQRASLRIVLPRWQRTRDRLG